MLFLIEYDRGHQLLKQFRSFPKSQQAVVEKLRLAIELKSKNEIVILDAEDEVALFKTHGRYFKSISKLVNSISL